jgi:hypothetical protein
MGVDVLQAHPDDAVVFANNQPESQKICHETAL